MIALRNVLIATDFGEAADAARAYGCDLARTFRATLHVLQVVDDVATRMIDTEPFAIDVVKLQEDLERFARKRLEVIVTLAADARQTVARS